jgi:hypothetical protein
MTIPISWEVPLAESITRLTISPLQGLSELLKCLIFHSGVLATPFQVCSLYARSSSQDNKTSDLLPSISPKLYRTNSNLSPQDYIQILNSCLLLPLSRTPRQSMTLYSQKCGYFLSPLPFCNPNLAVRLDWHLPILMIDQRLIMASSPTPPTI